MKTKSAISLVFLLQAIINGVNLSIAQKPDPHKQAFKCSNKGNLKSDKLLKERDEAFNLLYQSVGRPDRYTGYNIGFIYSDNCVIWTTSLCPPNIKMEVCMECVNNTIPHLKKNCPKQKEGVAWTALPNLNCMVRYEDYRTQQTLIDWAWTSFSSPPNETLANTSELEKGLNNLVNTLKMKANEIDNLER
ncbi:putative Gnk2-like domain-containing protein [Helianthus annuus]|nr:putative Gnk2-like domain-containing protein [Helianthus annuus]